MTFTTDNGALYNIVYSNTFDQAGEICKHKKSGVYADTPYELLIHENKSYMIYHKNEKIYAVIYNIGNTSTSCTTLLSGPTEIV